MASKDMVIWKVGNPEMELDVISTTEERRGADSGGAETDPETGSGPPGTGADPVTGADGGAATAAELVHQTTLISTTFRVGSQPILCTDDVNREILLPNWAKRLLKYYDFVKSYKNSKGGNVFTMKCKLCKHGSDKDTTYSSKDSRSFARHLEGRHKSEFQEYKTTVKEGADLKKDKPKEREVPVSPAGIPAVSNVTPYDANHPKQICTTNALKDMVAIDSIPFDITEGQGFRNFVATLDRKYVIPHRTNIQRHVKNDYNKLTTEMSTRLSIQPAGSLHLVADIWTTRSQGSVLGIKAQYIDPTWKLEQCTVGFKHFPGSHTANNIGENLIGVLKELGLSPSQIGSITVDNAANLNAAFKLENNTSSSDSTPPPGLISFEVEESDSVQPDSGEDFTSHEDIGPLENIFVCDPGLNENIYVGMSCWDHPHLHKNACLAHLLQLAVKDAIVTSQTVSSIVKRLNEIVTFFHNSPKYSSDLKQLTKGSTLVRPVATRWNSLYDCTLTILSRIDKFTMVECVNNILTKAREEKATSVAKITDDEVENLQGLCKLLQPFAELTDAFQKDSVSSSSAIIEAIAAMKELKEIQIDVDMTSHIEMKEFQNELVKSFCTRFTTDQDRYGRLQNERGRIRNIITIDIFKDKSYILAALLDPRFRLVPFEDAATKNTNFHGHGLSAELATGMLKTAFKELKDRSIGDGSQGGTISSSSLAASTSELDSDNLSGSYPVPKKRKIFALISDVRAESTKIAYPQNYYDEVDEYLKLCVTEDDLEKLCPLQFWKDHSMRFPILSQLARIYLAIPSSSGSVERLSSVAGAISRAMRRSIHISTMETLLFLRED